MTSKLAHNIRGSRPKKNPKRRHRVSPSLLHISTSGKRWRLQGSARGVGVPGRRGRASDPRKLKRAARRAGIRVNPTARRASFVVSVRHGAEKDWRKNFHQIAAFNSKVQALDYARALARVNKRATIKVEKR